MKNYFLWLWHLPRRLMSGLIFVYQKTLSPDHSFWAKAIFPHGYCPFEPTCSQYTREAFKKYGFLKGLFKGMGRIFRCHPWTQGGTDAP